ncbi:hypothetical protein TdN_01760 [Thermodesulfovibrio sp. TK110]
MSLYGYYRKTTPNLERLVEEGNFTVYTRCFSPAPWTVPAHVSLFTGLYPAEHLIDGSNFFLSDKFFTLPEILKSIGYKTFGISANALISKLFGFARGFDEFYELWNIFSEGKKEKQITKNFIGKKDLEKLKILIKSISDNNLNSFIKVFINAIYKKARPISKSATFSTLKALKIYKKIISKNTQLPIFLFINLMQTHDKYNPPTKYRNVFVKDNPVMDRRHHKESEYIHYAVNPFDKQYLEYLKGLYDQEILFLDTILYEMFKELKTELQDNTLFIITSDHGELFGEHGHIHHLFTTYNELIHVPLLIRYPEKYSQKTSSNSNLIQLHDIFSTIMDLVDAPFPKPQSSISIIGSEKRDFSISQLLDVEFKIEACKQRNPNFNKNEFPYNCSEISLINKKLYKLVLRSNGYKALYNLNNDFAEEKNLINERVFSSILSEYEMDLPRYLMTWKTWLEKK